MKPKMSQRTRSDEKLSSNFDSPSDEPGVIGWFLTEEKGRLEVLVRGGNEEEELQVLTDLDQKLNPKGTAPASKLPLYSMGYTQGDLHLLGGELRPGSGVIRTTAGRPAGPSGGLALFLASPSDGRRFFLGAAHVLTNYWRNPPPPKEDSKWPRHGHYGTIFRNQRGFPSPDQPRSIGTLRRFSPEPSAGAAFEDLCSNQLDAGLVEIESDFFELKQRTTCYGSLSGLDKIKKPRLRRLVMKCGPEEPHHTYAEVVRGPCNFRVVGPGGPGSPKYYWFRDHYLLETKPTCKDQDPTEAVSKDSTDDAAATFSTIRYPALNLEDLKKRKKRTATTLKRDPELRGPLLEPLGFAAPGDSGTLVVEVETRRAVGMVIAGSAVTGLYLMTPLTTLEKFWKKFGLVQLRG